MTGRTGLSASLLLFFCMRGMNCKSGMNSMSSMSSGDVPTPLTLLTPPTPLATRLLRRYKNSFSSEKSNFSRMILLGGSFSPFSLGAPFNSQI